MINVQITDLEKSLIGSILHDPSQFVTLKAHVPDDMFSVPLHRKAIQGMHLCAEQDATIDILNIETVVKLTKEETSELFDLYCDGKIGGYAPNLFRSLLNERTKERSLSGMRRIAKDITGGKSDAMEILAEMYSLYTGMNAEILSHVTRTKEDKLNEYQKKIRTGSNSFGIIPTPFQSLNVATNKGFRPSEYVLLGGRPGAGKTSFMLALALHAAKCGKRVAFLTGEMTHDEIMDRCAGIHTGYEINALKSPSYVDTMDSFIDYMRGLPLDIVECFENSIEELQREVGALIYKKYDMILIDYIQKFAYSPKAKDEFSEIQRVSGYIRNQSLKSNVVFVAASSMNRAEKSAEKMSLHSFYGSSKLGHDGTIGLILDAKEDDAAEMHTGMRPVTLTVAKNRSGARGEVNIDFELRSQRMTETGFKHNAVEAKHFQETEAF